MNTCRTCGEDFEPRNQPADDLYCSDVCAFGARDNSHAPSVMVFCATCGSELINTHHLQGCLTGWIREARLTLNCGTCKSYHVLDVSPAGVSVSTSVIPGKRPSEEERS